MNPPRVVKVHIMSVRCYSGKSFSNFCSKLQLLLGSFLVLPLGGCRPVYTPIENGHHTLLLFRVNSLFLQALLSFFEEQIFDFSHPVEHEK